jgi:hypothetical protein
MELTRRFLFKGYASAVSGLIYVPKTAVIDTVGATSVLGIAGGRARSEIAATSFADAVRIASATTLVEGVFDDAKQAKAVVSHKDQQANLASTTTVTADVREMGVGNNQGPFFTAKRLRATLVSRSPNGSGEPSITPASDTIIDGIAIDGYGLAITLGLRIFQTHDTHSKLVAAVDDAKVHKSVGRQLLMASGLRRPTLVSTSGIIYGTIVRDVRWTGKPFPGATIDGHMVIVPNFGKVYFGELLMSALERRMTLARFELGSPLGGYVGGGDVGSNGSWYP